MLYYICYYLNQNNLRKENPTEYFLDEPPDKSNKVSHDEHMDLELYDDIYRKGFKKLKDDCQKILNKYFDELGSKKIAKDLGLTPQNVRQKILRCKNALNKHLAKDPDYRRLNNNNEIP
jgi:DNA-directed RNA polymerase specialized sigma24 family protein